eukprot:7519383-Alexandrium_andersonii.AAC.1
MARQCRSPPRSASRPGESAAPLHALGARAARAQERSQNWSPTLPRGAFRAASRADSESADEG